MNWLKGIIVDILVTVFIGLMLWLRDPWMWWVILIYSALLFVAKGIALFNKSYLERAGKSQKTPDWVFHILYGINVVLLAIGSWWILTCGWILIWGFSYWGQQKTGIK